MTENVNLSSRPLQADTSRPLDTDELIERLAEELRRKSDSDLPRAYFVEQVKLQLAGQKTAEDEQAARGKPANRYETSDCFKSWAIPD